MSAISGEYGAVFYNENLTDTATTGSIFFNATGKTIISTGGAIDFETEGYSTGMMVTVSACTGESANNRIFTISAVSAGQLTVLEIVTDSEPEPSAVVFTEAEPGIAVCGFYSWSMSQAAEVHDSTDFCTSTGGRSYIAGITGWTATADKHFLTANNVVDSTGVPWWGTTVKVRFFMKYSASPSASDISQYYSGDAVVTGIDHTTPIDALVNQSISFQGDATATLVSEDDAWTS